MPHAMFLLGSFQISCFALWLVFKLSDSPSASSENLMDNWTLDAPWHHDTISKECGSTQWVDTWRKRLFVSERGQIGKEYEYIKPRQG